MFLQKGISQEPTLTIKKSTIFGIACYKEKLAFSTKMTLLSRDMSKSRNLSREECFHQIRTASGKALGAFSMR